jgi:hypothetical protein
MGRILLAALILLVMPNVSKACDSQMNVSVRQVGPPVRVVEKRRPAEFIVFRGDMRMQKDQIAMASKEQQREYIPLMEAAATSTDPFPAAEEVVETKIQFPPKPQPAAKALAKKVEPKKPEAKKAIAKKKDSPKATLAKSVAKASKKDLAKKTIAKKEAPKAAKKAVAIALKPKKHQVQRAPASIGPAIVVANQ